MISRKKIAELRWLSNRIYELDDSINSLREAIRGPYSSELKSRVYNMIEILKDKKRENEDRMKEITDEFDL